MGWRRPCCQIQFTGIQVLLRNHGEGRRHCKSYLMASVSNVIVDRKDASVMIHAHLHVTRPCRGREKVQSWMPWGDAGCVDGNRREKSCLLGYRAHQRN
jgi:hypothetical protein